MTLVTTTCYDLANPPVPNNINVAFTPRHRDIRENRQSKSLHCAEDFYDFFDNSSSPMEATFFQLSPAATLPKYSQIPNSSNDMFIRNQRK